MIFLLIYVVSHFLTTKCLLIMDTQGSIFPIWGFFKKCFLCLLFLMRKFSWERLGGEEGGEPQLGYNM